MEGKIIGIGGIFLKFQEPKKMTEWYANVLGMTTNDYGVLFSFSQNNETPGLLQLSTFPENTDYFGSDRQQAMLNFRVSNLDSFIERLKMHNVPIVDTLEDFEYGKFIHITDPEGNRIELWEPIDKAFSNEPVTKMY